LAPLVGAVPDQRALELRVIAEAVQNRLFWGSPNDIDRLRGSNCCGRSPARLEPAHDRLAFGAVGPALLAH